MILSKKQSIEDIIVETLAKNPYTEGPALVTLISKTRPKTTKQAVYTALKSLLQSETVAKVGSKYFLSRTWLQKIYKLFQAQKEKELAKDAVFELKDKQSISYHFPSLLSCDTYWAHVFNIFVEQLPKDQATFIYNPHELFVIGRSEIEQDIFTEFQKQKKHGYFVIRGNTALDKDFQKRWTSPYVAINTGVNLFGSNYYLNTFGDFLIEVYFNKKLVDRIEKFYQENQKPSHAGTLFLEELFASKYPIRMRISHNKAKASKLRKKLAKDFYIPKELKLD